MPRENPSDPFLGGRLRYEGQHQIDRALLERPNRVAMVVPVNPAIRRIRCGGIETGDLEGFRVHPCAVMI